MVPAKAGHVNCKSMPDFKRLMQDHMKDSSTKEVRAEELTLKLFGLVPADFNLVGETVDLLSEQTAAFYDYNKKRLFILLICIGALIVMAMRLLKESGI